MVLTVQRSGRAARRYSALAAVITLAVVVGATGAAAWGCGGGDGDCDGCVGKATCRYCPASQACASTLNVFSSCDRAWVQWPIDCKPPLDEELVATLKEVYEGLNGPSWEESNRWFNPAPDADNPLAYCAWPGLECTGKFITKLDAEVIMQGISAPARLPPAIGKLHGLRSINFQGVRSLRGPIPEEICNLTDLESVNLSSTEVEGDLPDCVGRLTALSALWLGHTGLRVPDTVFRLPNLFSLMLDGLDLQRPFPDVSAMRKLGWFHCSRCGLTGAVHESLWGLKELAALKLDGNEFDSCSLARLNELTALRDISMPRCAGPLPPSLGDDLPHLEYIELQGPVGGVLPASLSRLQSLSGLVIPDGMLTGPIPPLTSPVLRVIDLSGADNTFTGYAPGWAPAPSVTTARVPVFPAMPMGIPQLFPSAGVLALRAYGDVQIPEDIGVMSELTELSFHPQPGAAEGRFSGPLPDSLGNLHRLTSIDAIGNSLSGPIPESLAKIPTLTSLLLHYNRLDAMPRDMTGLRHLQVFLVEFNSIADCRGLEDGLASLPELANCDIRGNPCAKQASAALKARCETD